MERGDRDRLERQLLLLARGRAAHDRARRRRSIVSILANYVWTGSPGTIHSAAAKAGVMSMTQTLAVEWARTGSGSMPSRRARSSLPGAAKQLWNTQAAVEGGLRTWFRLKRWGKPEDVADAVAFLVSPHAGFITGEVVTVDGGAWLGKGPFGSSRQALAPSRDPNGSWQHP